MQKLIGLEKTSAFDLLLIEINGENIALQVTARQSNALKAAGIEIVTGRPPEPPKPTKKGPAPEPTKEPTKLKKAPEPSAKQTKGPKIFIESAGTLKNRIGLYLKNLRGAELQAVASRAKKMLEFTIELYKENLNPKIYIKNDVLFWDYETGQAKICLEPWVENILFPQVQQIAASYGQMVYLPLKQAA